MTTIEKRILVFIRVSKAVDKQSMKKPNDNTGIRPAF